MATTLCPSKHAIYVYDTLCIQTCDLWLRHFAHPNMRPMATTLCPSKHAVYGYDILSIQTCGHKYDKNIQTDPLSYRFSSRKCDWSRQCRLNFWSPNKSWEI
ncbi:hypothetical protein AVEN_133450-1 [Araneus ventricosus]|uniref:Uncharacterized protein n=1 Tax=Araneus ventricosus TaxID=182803 RepID=A0A4Y2H5T8_ARAVE|nr:hypothetical protein AVEN_133450-1 [Araneus ventricosus]